MSRASDVGQRRPASGSRSSRTTCWRVDVAAGHDARLHRRRPIRAGRPPPWTIPARRTGRRPRRRRCPSREAHGRAVAPSAWTLWAALAAPPEAYLAAAEAQDEDGRLPRDARRLAVEILVGDEVPDHDHPSPAAGHRAHKPVVEPQDRDLARLRRPVADTRDASVTCGKTESSCIVRQCNAPGDVQ